MKRIALSGVAVFVLGIWTMLLAALVESGKALNLGAVLMGVGCVMMVAEVFSSERQKTLDGKQGK